jgi:hypothetical protein
MSRRVPRPLRRRGRRGGGADVGLLRVAPFDRYPVASLRPLAGHADRLRVPEGVALARAHHRADEFLVVLAGEVVVHHDDDSSTRRPPERLGPGTKIGGTELLAGARHDRTLVAGPGLEVLVLYGPAFRWAARTLPDFASAL